MKPNPIRGTPQKMIFESRTKGAIRFGVDGSLYSRRFNGTWYVAYDKGIWNRVNISCLNFQDLELEELYRKWLKTASDAEIKAAQMTRDGKSLDPIFIRCLRVANASADGTVLAIGYGRHNPDGHMKSFPTALANALLDRGFLEFIKNAAWGDVYRITATGRTFIKSYDKA